MDLNSFYTFILVDQPSSREPPGLGPFVTTVLGWLVWIAGAAAVGTFIWIAIQMMVGRRNRSQMAADGLSGLPWVVGGLVLVAVAAALTNSVLKTANTSSNTDVITPVGSNLVNAGSGS